MQALKKLQKKVAFTTRFTKTYDKNPVTLKTALHKTKIKRVNGQQ